MMCWLLANEACTSGFKVAVVFDPEASRSKPLAALQNGYGPFACTLGTNDKITVRGFVTGR